MNKKKHLAVSLRHGVFLVSVSCFLLVFLGRGAGVFVVECEFFFDIFSKKMAMAI